MASKSNVSVQDLRLAKQKFADSNPSFPFKKQKFDEEVSLDDKAALMFKDMDFAKLALEGGPQLSTGSYLINTSYGGSVAHKIELLARIAYGLDFSINTAKLNGTLVDGYDPKKVRTPKGNTVNTYVSDFDVIKPVPDVQKEFKCKIDLKEIAKAFVKDQQAKLKAGWEAEHAACGRLATRVGELLFELICSDPGHAALLPFVKKAHETAIAAQIIPKLPTNAKLKDSDYIEAFQKTPKIQDLLQNSLREPKNKFWSSYETTKEPKETVGTMAFKVNWIKSRESFGGFVKNTTSGETLSTVDFFRKCQHSKFRTFTRLPTIWLTGYEVTIQLTFYSAIAVPLEGHGLEQPISNPEGDEFMNGGGGEGEVKSGLSPVEESIVNYMMQKGAEGFSMEELENAFPNVDFATVQNTVSKMHDEKLLAQHSSDEAKMVVVVA
jgi:hypothetical protein